MPAFLRSTKKRLRLFVRKASFHNKVLSTLTAHIRYRRLRNSYPESIINVGKVIYGKEYVLDGKRDKPFIMDLLFSEEYYAISPEEYTLFGINRSKGKEKLNYIGWNELYYYYCQLDKLGRPEVFSSKEKTYEVFKEYYKREVLLISSAQQKEDVFRFLEKHHAAMVKPDEEYGGHGIEIIRLSAGLTSDLLWERLSNKCPFVLEELIEQVPEMNVFYPHAVNTIRYHTFFFDGKLERVQAVLRMGRGNSVVDNASSGGMFVLVDTESGRILGPAKDLKGNRFEAHPDTGVRFEGKVIPRWNDLNALLEKLVRVLPEQKQIGWDFALSEKGWVIVEGNTTPMFQKFDQDHGLREQVAALYGKVIPIWK